ncbi:MAG TPA: hypothetical protein VIN05_11435 [Roseovarius sp.]
MMMFRTSALVSSLFFTMGNPAFSQASEDVVLLARSFIGHCVQNVGRVDKVASAARSFGWNELEGDMKDMLAPQNPNVDYSGWMVADEGQIPFLLGTSSAVLDGVDYSICVVANPDAPVDDVLSEIRKLMTFGQQIDNVEEAGQRYRVWSTNALAKNSFVSAIDAPKMGIFGGTISLSAPTEK